MAILADSGRCHVVAIPYPGRGHINPLMNLCKIIAQRRLSDFVITFIVTEEWLGLIGSEHKPDNIRFATIPNVLPSEEGRAKAFPGSFMNAVQTKMEHPVEQLLHRMEVPANVLVYDTYLIWVLNLGKRMGIPIASFYSLSANVFSMIYHYDLLVKNGHVGDDFSEKFDEEVDYIPGVLPIRVADLPTGFNGRGKQITPITVEAVSMVPKAQFHLFVCVYELEAKVIDFFKSELSIPVYTVGPGIPYFNLNDVQTDQCTPDYIKWLDGQPEASVLYISQGSFLSVSDEQLEEIIAGVRASNVRYMLVARGETTRFKNENEEKGLVISWCDQLKVLCHGSIGGFWSHCGWNSTKEGAFAGVPMLTCPIQSDQTPNSKMIVEDWKMGERVKIEEDSLLTREEIAKLIRRFMDRESEDGKEMRKRAKEVKKICQQATTDGGSAETDIDLFISDILKSRNDK